MDVRPQTGAVSPNSTGHLSPTANEFPRQAGQTLQVSKRDNGLISPAKSTFSFTNEEPESQPTSNLPDLIDEKQISRHISRGAPGDAALMSMVQRDQEGTDLARRKSQFYSEVFAYREPNLTPRERISKTSVITAEVKTNVIVKDEFVFLEDLSQHLSQRYQRPTSSIFITLDHSACLLLAGTFESAYILTITALPSQIQPVTNKRNTALVQAFMTDSLGVSADRGVVRFVGVGEEYLGTNGNTVLGEIENLSKGDDEGAGTARSNTIRRGRSRKVPKPKDLTIQIKSRPATAEKAPSPPLKSPPMPAMPTEKSTLDKKAEKVQKMGRRKSFLSMFGK